jgi:pullulanase
MMRNRSLSVLLMLALSLAFVVSCGSSSKKKSGEYTGDAYTIHYYAYSGDYTSASAVWVWQNQPSSSAGSQTLSYSTDSFGKVFKVPIIDGCTQIGLIFKQSGTDDASWTGKSSNIYINVNSNGDDEIWMLEGIMTPYTTKPSTNPRLIVGCLDGAKKIYAKFTGSINTTSLVASYFKVTNTSVTPNTDNVVTAAVAQDEEVNDGSTLGYKWVDSTTIRFVLKPGIWAMDCAPSETGWAVTGNFITEAAWSAGPTTFGTQSLAMTWDAANGYYATADITGATAIAGKNMKFVNGSTWAGPSGYDNILIKTKAKSDELFGKATEFILTVTDTLDPTAIYTVGHTTDGTTVDYEAGTAIARDIFNQAKYQYAGTDLGCTYASGSSVFKVFAPNALTAKVQVFDSITATTASATYDMTKGTSAASGDCGVFSATVTGDLKAKYYNYTFTGTNGMTDYSTYSTGIVDPYAKLVVSSSNKALIFDPADVAETIAARPDFPASAASAAVQNRATDAVVYEISVRDMTIDPASGVSAANRGKYLGLTETGKTTPGGRAAGIDHIADLGVTHVQIMPFYDWVNKTGGEETWPYVMTFEYASGDEKDYDWGYMPAQFNTPEGIFATTSGNNGSYTDAIARIKEAKQMVNALHNKGVRVIMDGVYNHTDSGQSPLNKIAPYYYFRTTGASYTSYSGCGDDIKSENYMTDKFIRESCSYWINEYKISGFRFDLMGLMESSTIAGVYTDNISSCPGLVLYGEAWAMGESPSPAQKGDQKNLNYGCFQDTIRDNIKGSQDVSNKVISSGKGFIQGSGSADNDKMIALGLRSSNAALKSTYGATDYNAFTAQPTETVNYVSCHDNVTLWDKLLATSSTENERIAMDKLAGSIVLFAQGIPFIHSGCEMARTKGYGESTVPDKFYNSNNNPDGMNKIDWTRKDSYIGLYNYYKGMIAMRKAHPMFRYSTWSDVNSNTAIANTAGSNYIVYSISDVSDVDSWTKARVYLNGSSVAKTESLTGTWYLETVDTGAVVESAAGSSITIPAHSAVIIRQ